MRIQFFLHLKSNSKAWKTKIAHHNVSLRRGKDLSLETKMLLMSHCFVESRAEMPTLSIEFVVHPTFFIHITCYCHNYTTYFAKKKNPNDIIKGERDNNEGVLH